MRPPIAKLAIPALLAGCAAAAPASPVAVTPLAGSGAFPAQAFIQVLQAAPPGPYIPIAQLVVSGAAGLDRAQALTAMEQKARALGANALILTEERRQQQPTLTFNPSGGSYSLAPPQTGSGLRGEAIHLGANNQ